MSALLLSVLGASLLGSLHCAGMCGGIVTFACSSAQPSRAIVHRRQLPVVQRVQAGAHFAYHGGRLLTYATLGAGAGAIGSALDLAGSLAGLSHAAALLAGVVIVVWALAALLPGRWKLAPLGKGKRSVFSRAITRLAELPTTTRAALLGICTGALPCGWLYAFVVIAAGTGSAASGALVLASFWVGTVPVLVGLGSVARWLSTRLGRALPVFGAVLLLVLGIGNVWLRLDDLTRLLHLAADADAGAHPADQGDAMIDDATAVNPKPACH